MRRLAVVSGGVALAAGVVLGLATAVAAQTAPAPLTVTEAVATSLAENASLRQARHGLDGARAQVREAWGNVMPQVNLSASFTRNLEVPQFFLPATFLDPTADPDAVVPVRAGSDNAWFAQARADQPLFNAAAFMGVGAADRYEGLQREVLRGEAQEVATRTRLRYYDVLLAQEQVRLTAESVARVAQVVDETRKLRAAGLASEYDVLRLEVELSNLEPNLRRSRSAMDAARRALAVEMGVDTLSRELAGSLLTLDLPPLPADEVVHQAAANRSDLRQLAMMRELRATERRVEMSQYLPRVSVFGTWTVNAQGNDTPTWFGDSRFSTSAVGVQVDMPLFSGLQRPARVSRITAVVQQVESQLQYARELAGNEVKTLLDQARESHERAVAQRRAVAQASRGYDIARLEYGTGTGSQIQVTDAELALRQSEFNYAQAVHDYLAARARLDAAIGMVPLVDDGDLVALQE